MELLRSTRASLEVSTEFANPRADYLIHDPDGVRDCVQCRGPGLVSIFVH